MRALGVGCHSLNAVLYVVLYTVLYAVLYTVLYAALYSGGRRGRAPFASGAKVMRYVLEFRALRAGSAGRQEGRGVGAVMCCVLLVHRRCVMYAGGCALCARDAGGNARCAALYAGGGGG